ncbi:DUF998 domain-containing protein [Lysobacter korlensis]|uniref:DUF998 domain-containing protein n=1 Tax=Lysobacter korlensis TaxID=553636 RepID=A0ABV6S339_9GAMM
MENRIKLARVLAVGSVGYAIAFYMAGGALKPGYSHTANFISELNATGTPWAQELGLFGFVPLGLLLAAFLWVAYPVGRAAGASRSGFLLLWSQPLAYIGVAAAPCDPGCPADGSSLQQVHNLLGLVTYFAAAAGFFLLSFHPRLAIGGRWFLRTAAIAWLGLFIVMLAPEFSPVRGLLQRVAEAILWSCVLLVAWRMLGRPDHASAAPNNSSKPTPLRGAA